MSLDESSYMCISFKCLYLPNIQAIEGNIEIIIKQYKYILEHCQNRINTHPKPK